MLVLVRSLFSMDDKPYSDGGLSEFAPTLEGYLLHMCMQIMFRNALLIFEMENISGPSQTPVNMSARIHIYELSISLTISFLYVCMSMLTLVFHVL